jgi:hypothetical protein
MAETRRIFSKPLIKLECKCQRRRFDEKFRRGEPDCRIAIYRVHNSIIRQYRSLE